MSKKYNEEAGVVEGNELPPEEEDDELDVLEDEDLDVPSVEESANE